MHFLALLLLQGVLCGATRPGTMSSSQWQTYTVQGVNQSNAGGLEIMSKVSLTNDQKLQYGPSLKELEVQVQPQTAHRLYIKITPEGQQRWQVPETLVPRPSSVQGLSAKELLYEVKQPLTALGQPFALTVTRKATGQPVFNTQGHSFLFKDQFIELTTSIPEDSDLYGVGESSLSGGLLLPRNGKVVSTWSRDSAASEPDINTYSAQPFYLQLNKDGTAQGVLLLNSNGMDILLNKTSVTFRSIGGIVELYLFMGPTPEEVIRQYHEVIGRPAMPPFWALGAHQGRWGYTDLAELEAAVANYSAAGLPLEGLWTDIELMDNRFKVFTFDTVRYPVARVRQFIDKMHAAGQHWAPIFNPGISTSKGYRAYEEGTAEGLWIKDVNGKPYIGQVWPGEVVYPSYLGDKAANWLKSQMQSMHDQVPFDGMWLDMSEAANFCSGMVCRVPRDNKTAVWALEMPTPLDFNATKIVESRVKCHLKCQLAPQSNKLANPPYSIHNFGWKEGIINNDANRVRAVHGIETSHLDLKGISVTATHPDGTREYDAHNLYGTSMARHFYNTYKQVSNKRPFMLTRSTFPGAGRFTGHWTGDTKVSWRSFREQTANILNANMWGLSMTGADICGYGIEGPPIMTDEQLQELCVRWTSAGAFYPFSRNHMNYFTTPHEPYRWASTTAAAKKAYGLRYRLLSYLYGSMFLAHKKGGTLARPILFSDPSDIKARNATWQWMLGEAVMVSPVLTNETNVIEPHFTAGSWYSAWDYSRLDSKGDKVRMSVPLGDIAVHVRGGAILPMQEYAPVTRDMRWSAVTLLVTLPGAPGSASDKGPGPVPPYGLDEQCATVRNTHTDKLVSCGLLYADNDSQEAADTDSLQAWFRAITDKDGNSGVISSSVATASAELSEKLRITQVHIVGLPRQGNQPVQSKTMHAIRARTSLEAWKADRPAVSVSASGSQQAAQAEYDGQAGVLRISGLNLLASESFSINWHLA